MTRLVALTLVALASVAPTRIEPQSLALDGALLTEPGELPRFETEADGRTLRLPLEHTDVQAKVSGFVARVEVTQRYKNPHDRVIEAVYVFPLPQNSAVDDYQMVVGERTIEGVIRRREEARRTYEEAKRRGHTAALLEQDRPNVFTQSVANIPPGESIEVRVRYVQDLAYDDGAYELVFPMVVGPRYHPGAPLQSAPAGTGAHRDTTEVPDASRVSPLLVPEGMRSGHDISVRVEVDAGLPLRDFEVPTHDVDVRAEGDERLVVATARHDHIPNRDFVLRWWVDRERVQTALLAHRDTRGGFFSLMVQPPKLALEELVGRRELVFVVDVSGSMGGLPLYLCQEAMREAISRLRPHDTFNVLTFAGTPGRLWKSSRRATHANIDEARSFVDRMAAGGGTEMLDAVAAALSTDVEEGRHRYVFFLTDGYVGNERAIMAQARRSVGALERPGRKARVFTYGVGSSVNRFLIGGLARAGKGVSFHATNREDPSRGVDRFFRVIDRAVLEEVSIDWNGLPVVEDEVYPQRLPDLFASRPLVVHGRFQAPAEGTAYLKARTRDGAEVKLPIEVRFAGDESRNESLASLWARARVRALEDAVYGAGDGWSAGRVKELRESVTRIGLEYRLVTPYTSFVAVDRSRVVGDGAAERIVQPVESPEDVQRHGADVSGVLGVLGGASGTGVTGAGGEGKLGLKGTAGGSAYGVGGLGIRGTGRGGGGSASSTIGLGNVGTRGYGGGVAAPSGGAAGARGKGGKLAGRSASVPKVVASKVVVRGSLDKSVIQRVIRQHTNQIRYCYERELTRAGPGLAGRLVVAFTIDAQGQVKAARIEDDTVGNEAMASCIVRRVKTWRFPKVAGGGTVVVRYPFVFQPAE